jgi:hypothetical protein
MDTASWSLPCTAESICAWAKLAVRRFKPMPSTIVSYGFRKRVPSASALAYSTPRVTYANRGHRRLTPTEGVQMYARGQTPLLALVAPWCHARVTLANKQQQHGPRHAILHAKLVHLIIQAGSRRVHQHHPGAGVMPLQDLRHARDGAAGASASHKCMQLACCLGYNL